MARRLSASARTAITMLAAITAFLMTAGVASAAAAGPASTGTSSPTTEYKFPSEKVGFHKPAAKKATPQQDEPIGYCAYDPQWGWFPAPTYKKEKVKVGKKDEEEYVLEGFGVAIADFPACELADGQYIEPQAISETFLISGPEVKEDVMGDNFCAAPECPAGPFPTKGEYVCRRGTHCAGHWVLEVDLAIDLPPQYEFIPPQPPGCAIVTETTLSCIDYHEIPVILATKKA